MVAVATPPQTDDRSLDGIGVPPAGVAVSVDQVSKVYGTTGSAVAALDRISLSVRTGELVCVVGASGCGKSTLLTLLAGLDHATSGVVEVNAGKRIRGGMRTPALMFQESALFPWLTVEQNIDMALRLRKRPKDERRRRVTELLASVHLSGFEKKRPHELSGGMRQRVALARALAQEAEVLLMDEPFGALDAITRDLLHDEVERVWTNANIGPNPLSIIFVTHNVREAVRLGDRVVLLSSRPGRVVREFPVAIPRPRRIDAPEVATLSATITDALRGEVARHGR
jgi:NitT/TauT family transport system ATP-binding protein